MSIAGTHLVSRRYNEVFGMNLAPAYANWLASDAEHATGAALGYRRAGDAPLFLECYLDCPVEALVSETLARPVERAAIVEIGNFAADNAMAMIELWGAAANDLGGANEVAVATLTAPLRRMFARIGLPITVLAPARRECLGEGGGDWGTYYDLDPQVCMGVISEGQDAINTFLARRHQRKAA